MKFTCLQENLVKGLSIISKAIPTRGALPILSNVLIETDKGKLKLSSTNLETAIVTNVPASIDEKGAVTVPAKILLEFVSHLSPGAIEGVLKKDILHLSSGGTNSKFNGVNASDFPDLPKMPKDAKVLNLDPNELARAVSSVAFSAAVGDSRPVLSGVFLGYKKGTLTLAASDGFRLSERTIKVKDSADSFAVVVPAKTLLEAARMFAGAEEPVKMVLNDDENLVLFESSGTLVATRMIDGAYPDYQKIIPSKNSLSAQILVADLLEAVKLTNVFAKEINSVINLIFDPKGHVKVTSSHKETGENNSQLASQIEGDLTEISFSSKYLLDFLNNVKAEELVFETSGNVAPGVFKPVDQVGYIHIVMPVRVKK